MKCLRGCGGESMFGISLTTLLCAIVFTQVVEGKVRCYVCHWQSPYQTPDSMNMTDTCSHYNFDPAYAVIHECDGGCEAVSIRRGKNENIVNFYKNCLSKTSQVEDKCTITEDKNMRHISTCECTSDLCNGAGRVEKYTRNFFPHFVFLMHWMKEFFFGLMLKSTHTH